MSPEEKRSRRFEASKTAENPQGVYIDPREDGTSKGGDLNSARIPDLIKIGAIPSTTAQNLTTDVIDATTISQQRCRFTLQRVAGFLHSNSKITLGIVPDAANARAFYPLNVGISNLVKSAELKIGQKTVCAVDDYSSFHSYQSIFISNENNKEREQFLSQRCVSHAPIYDSRVVNASANPVNSATKVGLDLGRNPVVDDATDIGEFQLLPFQTNDGTSAQTIADAPVYSVYLSDLFPFLKTNQLPCFMIDEEIHIDITFQDQTSTLSGGGALSRRMCVSSTETATTAFQIDTDEVKLIYDSITYDGELMRQYAAQNKTLTFNYVDYRLAKRTGDQTAFSNLVFPMGGNGRLVSKVMFALTADANVTPTSLLNGVVAKESSLGGKLSVNLLYNDLFEYNVDRSNPALLFHTIQQAEGMVPMVTKDEWKIGGIAGAASSALTTQTFEGHDQASSINGLGGCFQWMAIRPNKGQRVNNKGMDLVYKQTGLAAGTYTLRCYLELLKVATIKDGQFECYFA
tara:strand:+ start:6909 stop:8459 length:1551 start_codon:yes stop_codon:yes gene_type:complete